jgi:gamma-glutamylcyclotransferase (GGCT)/AIG2-like uncharacterized protein YtfP
MAEVFVYGTLRKNKTAHNLISQAPGIFIKEVRTTPKYHLYDVGSFPGMIEDDSMEGEGILGEVWQLPEAAFKNLDRYECVSTGLFRRGKVELSDGTTADAYFFNSDMQNATLIEGGIWQ